MVTTMMMIKLMIVNTVMMTIDRRLVLKRVRCFEPDREGDRSAWPAPTLLFLVKIITAGSFLSPGTQIYWLNSLIL
mgnify:CR=1 FL=1